MVWLGRTGVLSTAAWVLFGNFQFPAGAAGDEGYPSVPRGKVLISFGDFPVAGKSARWRRVTHLRLPTHPTRKRLVSWHVRFAGRAVYAAVKFGSRPSARTWRLASAKLRTVHREQRQRRRRDQESRGDTLRVGQCVGMTPELVR